MLICTEDTLVMDNETIKMMLMMTIVIMMYYQLSNV